MPKPRNADTLADSEPVNPFAKRIDAADDFVARNDRHMRVRQLAIHHVQIRRHTPHAATFTRTSPGPGCLSDNCVHTSGVRRAFRTMACMGV